MDSNLQIFGRALSERQEAMITISPTAPKPRQFPIRFEQPADADARKGFWASVENPDTRLLADLVANSTTISVSFNVGSAILSFPTVIFESKKTFLRGWRLRLRLPMVMKLVERRSSKRHPVPLGSLVTAVVRRNFAAAAAAAAAGASPSKFDAKMLDISSGGASFLCRHADLIPPFKPDEPLILTLAFGEEPLELSARHRHTRPHKSGGLQVGLQFSEVSLRDPQLAERIEHLITVMETRHAELSIHSAMRA